MNDKKVFKYNLVFYDLWGTAWQNPAMIFCLKKQVSFELIMGIINKKLKQDEVFKNIHYFRNADILYFGLDEQLNIKQKERLYKIVKPIVQRYQ